MRKLVPIVLLAVLVCAFGWSQERPLTAKDLDLMLTMARGIHSSDDESKDDDLRFHCGTYRMRWHPIFTALVKEHPNLVRSLIGDPKCKSRTGLLCELSQLKDPRDLGIAKAFFASSNGTFRVSAVVAAGQIGTAEGLRIVHQGLKDRSRRVRYASAIGLVKSDPDAAAMTLTELVQGEKSLVALFAGIALKQIKPTLLAVP